jgi:hypothetical protein
MPDAADRTGCYGRQIGGYVRGVATENRLLSVINTNLTDRPASHPSMMPGSRHGSGSHVPAAGLAYQKHDYLTYLIAAVEDIHPNSDDV